MLKATLLTLFLLAAPALAGGGLVINEVDVDQIGLDTAEFIELYNAAGAMSLDNQFLALYDGGAANDQAYRVYGLAGQSVPADGYFVIGASGVPNVDYTPGNWPANEALQDGADAVALWFDPTGLIGPANFFGTGPSNPPAGVVLLDAVVYDTSDPDDAALIAALTPADAQVDENSNGLGFAESLQRVPDGSAPTYVPDFLAKAPTPGASNGPSAFTDLGSALAGVSGPPVLSGYGSLDAGSLGFFDLSNAAPSALTVLFVGTTVGGVPFKGGTFVPFPFDLSVSLGTGPTGNLVLGWLNWPPGVPPGFEFVLQCWIVDAAGPFGVSASNGLGAEPK